MNNIGYVNFRGSGAAETTGSIGHKNNPKECPTCGKPISFKGYDSFEKEDKKGISTAAVIGSLAVLTAATIGGLGYAHKAGWFEKLGEGWMKKTIGKLEPAGKKCRGWCSTIKTKGNEYWVKVKDFFSSKKS